MAATRGPIFVVGPAGSGTTLMRLILDSHDDIAIAQETGFARALLANEHVPFWEFGAEWYGRLGLGRDDLEKELGAFYGGLFSRFAASQGATRWGDKTPFHLWHLPLLARVFPDAQFIGMARHPGATAHSTRRRMRHPWDDSLRYWARDTVEMLAEGAALGERFVLCRYEDLVTRPEPVLRELFEWLGEPWSDQLLSFHEVHRTRGTAAEVEGATRSDKPIDPSRIGAWAEALDADRFARLRRGRVGRLARLLGYRADRPVPGQSWGTTADSILLTGSQLTRLMSDRPGVDWERRPRPSFANRALRAEELERLRRLAAGGTRPPQALERVAERAGGLGRRVLYRLPPDARARVRRLLERGRR